MTSSLPPSPAADLRGLSRAPRPDAGDSVAPPRSRWKSRVVLPVVILLIMVALLLVTSARTLLPATPVRVVPVVVKTVEGAAGAVGVQAPGWLEPDPHPYYVPALADGIVQEMLVLEGAPVEADQVVARLVDDDARLALARADAEVLRRESELVAAAGDLHAARLQLEHLIERSRAVAVATARAAEASSEAARVRADVRLERARLDELQDEYDRKSQLTASQAVSEATVARLRLRLDGQRAAIAGAEARGAVAEAKQRVAEAELDAETTNRELLIEERRAVTHAEAAVGTAEAFVALARAVRDEAALRLDRMAVRSPVAGIVMRRLVSPGSKLTRSGAEHSAHVIHVYDPRHLQVRVDVPLADAAHVLVGQQAEVVVEVLPDRKFTGRVTRIVHEADIQKNTVEVKVALDDPTVELKPDMLARAKFLTERPAEEAALRQRVFAPASLVRRGAEGGSTALVVTALVDQRGRAEARTVTPGTRAIDGWIEIEAGLRVGDLLIGDPPADLRHGDRVRVIGERLSERGG